MTTEQEQQLFAWEETHYGSFEGYRTRSDYHSILVGEPEAILTKYPRARPYTPVVGHTQIEHKQMLLTDVEDQIQRLLTFKAQLVEDLKKLKESPPEQKRFYLTDCEYGYGKRRQIILSDDPKLAEAKFREIEKLEHYRKVGIFTPERVTKETLEQERKAEQDLKEQADIEKRKKLELEKKRLEKQLAELGS